MAMVTLYPSIVQLVKVQERPAFHSIQGDIGGLHNRGRSGVSILNPKS